MLDTDLTDEQWLLIEPFIPLCKWGGRPRTTNERHVLNSIMYLVKTGCQWRQLCRYDDLPWQTVYRYFVAWRKKGVWRKIQHTLVEKVRLQDNRTAHPSAVVIDSQSTRTGKLARVETRGYDGGKKVKGRKRHVVVDTNGLLIDVSVTSANVHDKRGGRKVLSRIARRVKVRDSIQTVYADKGYSGKPFAQWVKRKINAVVEIGENLAQKVKRFVPAKKRWVVERTFAWLRDYKRLIEDVERSVKNSVTMIRLAFIKVLLRKLSPSDELVWT